jgi:hypothetical protein
MRDTIKGDQIGEVRNALCLQNFSLKSEGQRALGRPRHRWEDYIKVDKEIGRESMDWIQLAQNTVQLTH